MLGFDAFRGVTMGGDAIKALKGGEKISLGAHNSLLQLSNVSGYTNPTAWGAAAGAAYGAADGAFSYDGSFFGGAFHGAMLGATAGAGLKFAANTYAKGAAEGIKLESGAFRGASLDNTSGAFSNAWSKNTSGRDGKQVGAFQWGYFGAGF